MRAETDDLRKNKGFTLVELIISLGIMTIVMGAIFSFFLFNYKTFIRTENNTEAQYSLQKAMNTIIDNIIYAKGIYTDDDNPVLVNGDEIKRIAFIRDDLDGSGEEYYIISLDEDADGIKKLFYTIDSTDPEEEDNNGLADYIDYLKMSPLDGDYASCKGVIIEISSTKGGENSILKNRVYFRNAD